MKTIRTSQLLNSSNLWIYSERESIEMSPDYQRMGEIWTLEKRQLLIDSILNGFDIPKLYFHEFVQPKKLSDGRHVRYAIIDGRQRLESLWSFIDNDFPLSSDFEYFDDSSIDAKTLTYRDLGKNHPKLKNRFDSYTLPIITVVTDDIDLIEEMFSRLNEAVPLNAAEKRNAFGGFMAEAIRKVANHQLFKRNIPFSNKRYQHREMAAKFLLLEYSLIKKRRIIDTKKIFLDDLVRRYRTSRKDFVKQLQEAVEKTIAAMAQIFTMKDPLLKTQAMTVVYFLVFKDALGEGWVQKISRDKLVRFNRKRQENRDTAEKDITKADYDLLEFDRMSLQGTNDASSIKFRTELLLSFLKPSQGEIFSD